MTSDVVDHVGRASLSCCQPLLAAATTNYQEMSGFKHIITNSPSILPGHRFKLMSLMYADVTMVSNVAWMLMVKDYNTWVEPEDCTVGVLPAQLDVP